MTGQDVEQYFFNNPPFEVTDKVKYLEFLQFQSSSTMIELSENNPVFSEATIDPIVPAGLEDRVLFDLKSIHEGFMDLVLLYESSMLPDIMQNPAIIRMTGNTGFGYVGSNAVTAAMRSNSVLNLLAVNEYLPIIEEWFASKKQFLIFNNSFVKLVPNTEYYTLYKRYKTINELNPSEIRTFKNLFGINIMLDIYQTDIFASEGGIRSVSLSGLSVSFNVPEASAKVRDLQKQKSEIMATMSIDYSDGCVGLI